MIYLDTQAVVWLMRDADWMSPQAQRAIDAHDLLISPIVALELEMLHQKQRLRSTPDHILDRLANAVGLRVCDLPFWDIVKIAIAETWTRDPFDRLIVSHAKAQDALLLTSDQQIHLNYRRAIR